MGWGSQGGSLGGWGFGGWGPTQGVSISKALAKHGARMQGAFVFGACKRAGGQARSVKSQHKRKGREKVAKMVTAADKIWEAFWVHFR